MVLEDGTELEVDGVLLATHTDVSLKILGDQATPEDR